MSPPKVPSRIGRRCFVAGASSLPLLGVLGCKKQSTHAPAPVACSDVTGLSAEAIQLRQRLEYVDQTPFAGKVCSDCQHYVPPKPGEACGGCKVIPGKIAPNGYSKLFTPSV